ncbi:MAG: undecaprenyldiphospho-muramoylpentapeptide beta-N-acetylglucosaminyltransferase [Gammaproteobacteria bacterium]|nr:undecaprenyldiphospho-muramoylpentapeptide beta-N-acetylglucosaminyltransferase [Gammaproteobacteria bacterium]
MTASATAAGTRPILIMAGGTGGHVFPALAVAECLRARGVPVTWLGTRRGLEARVVPGADFPIDWIWVGGLRGKGALTLGLAPFKLALAFLQALSIMARRRPAAVLGMGGFVTGPGGVVAWLLRRPLLIHEQNALPGLTNRWLARLATRVMEAFPGSLPARYRPVSTGNPVRAAIAALDSPERRLSARAGATQLLVLGGSLGAQVFNETVPEALGRLLPEHRPRVWHQTGRRHLEAARERYRKVGLQVRLEDFIEDMAAAYAWADLVLCRAGALTVAELAAAGVGAILVPYPHAVDDHQTHNARYLAQAGAALLLPQAQMTAERLAELLGTLGRDRARLQAMARAARALAKPDAAERVAELCLQAAAGRGGSP